MPNSLYAATALRDDIFRPHCVPGGRMGPMMGSKLEKSTEATGSTGFCQRGGRRFKYSKPGRGRHAAKF
jgi:hypothetical protein